MRIYFYPLDISSSNSYISRICQSIKKVDESIEIKPLLYKKWKEILYGQIFWLNWYEDLGHNSFFKTLKKFIIRMIYFSLMKMFNGKIIFVLHNKRPHEILSEKLSIFFLRFLLLYSDMIIILNDDSLDAVNKIAKKDLTLKTHKVLHPSYQCSPKHYSNKQRPFRILFTGLIRPYKNIEMLLDIAKIHPEFEFIISGKPCDALYAASLRERADQLPNISLRMKYNSETELEELMDAASICVLPYHLESTLNSGVAMYAFSKGLNVVMPAIGTVNELKNRNCVFSYTYTDNNQHFNILDRKIMEAYELYTNNYGEFVKRAENIKKEVLERCSIESVSMQIRKTGILDL